MPHPVSPAPVPADHATHDPVLIAAYAAGDAAGSELDTATALVAGCTACADLHQDLLLIAAALPGLPVPRRTRDFRLTPQQAESLRPAGWRRLVAPFAGPRFAFAAPLGSGLAVLGIAGILLAGTGLPLGSATSGGAPAEAPLAAAPPAAPPAASPATEDGSLSMPAASAAPAPEIQSPVAAPDRNAGTAAGASPAGGPSQASNDKNAAPVADPSPEGVSGAAAAASPADGFETPGEAVGVVGARDQAAEHTGNGPLPVLAAVMLVAGATMAGFRVLARRIA